MFVVVAGLLTIVCGVLIGFGCWWPPRAGGLSVATVERRLAFESYCRTLESQWPAHAPVDRERVLARLRAIAPERRSGSSTFVPCGPHVGYDDLGIA